MEFVFILKGQLEIRVREEVFTLKAGDSIHYQGSHPHAWRNESGKECMLIWALSALSPRQGMGRRRLKLWD
ncbi:MAG: cupin domain-containing protein [Anaerolineae bacterium]